MENKEMNVISDTGNLRSYIIEHALVIEEVISETLGHLLDIDWKVSKSFGYSSSALSFNQKVQIIQDIKGLSKVDGKKLTALMSIRNKFAHVKSIESFNDFFNSGENGKIVKRDLDGWYSHIVLEPNINEEDKFKSLFLQLTLDTAHCLFELSMDHVSKKAYKKGEEKAAEMVLEALKAEVLKLENGRKILNKIYIELQESIKTD